MEATLSPLLRGRHTLFHVLADGTRLLAARGTNTWAYTWGFVAARCIGLGAADYRLAAMYIEYENVADPTDAVDVPSFDRSDDLSYYDGLAPSLTRDYLRVPLVITPAIHVAAGYEAHFEAGQGNLLTVFAQSSGAAGVFGRDFSAGANSKVCGVALVAAPVLADRTRDVLFARSYYDVADQVVKADNGQIGIEYELSFL